MSISKNLPNNVAKRPFFRLLGAQIGAAVVVGGLETSVNLWSGLGLELWILVACQALFSSIFSLFIGMGRGWALAQFILPWAIWGALSLAIPSWIYLACFALTYAFFRNASGERVPLYLSNRTTWQGIEQLLENEQGSFIDLGSGIGGTISYLGKAKPKWRFVGVENAPLSFVFSWFRAKFAANNNVSIIFGDIWNVDLGKFDVVYAFLSPAPMERLLEKVKKDMRPGTVFVSNSFWHDDVQYDECRELSDGRKTNLYIKKM